jgi:hypothetical protein
MTSLSDALWLWESCNASKKMIFFLRTCPFKGTLFQQVWRNKSGLKSSQKRRWRCTDHPCIHCLKISRHLYFLRFLDKPSIYWQTSLSEASFVKGSFHRQGNLAKFTSNIANFVVGCELCWEKCSLTDSELCCNKKSELCFWILCWQVSLLSEDTLYFAS